MTASAVDLPHQPELQSTDGRDLDLATDVGSSQLFIPAATAFVERFSTADYWSVPQKPFLWQNRLNRKMNSRLPCLTTAWLLLAAIAVVASPTDQAADASKKTTSATSSSTHVLSRNQGQITAGDRLLLQATGRLEQRSSISARLRYQGNIDNSQIYGVGSYWQQGQGDSLRVRFEVQVAGQNASLLQISNSRFLWMDRQLPAGRRITRIDLREVRAATQHDAKSLDEARPGEATWSTLETASLAHSGGLPGLLASIHEHFSLMPPQAMRLASTSPTASRPVSIPVFAIVGHWRVPKLAAVVAPPQAPEDGVSGAVMAQRAELQSISPRLPQEVLLLVGQADLFPYRIEYRRLETPAIAPGDAQAAPYQLSPSPIVAVEFSDVAFDVPIDAGTFDYSPGNAEWIDQTAVVLERLYRERQGPMTTRQGKRASAATDR